MTAQSVRILAGLSVVALVAGVWVYSARRPAVPAEPGRIEAQPRRPSDRAPQLQSAERVNRESAAPDSGAAVEGSVTDGLTPEVRVLVDEQADYELRSVASRNLKAPLASADLQALFAFLLQRSPLDESQHGHVLKNQLLDALCAMNPPSDGLADVLAQMYRDPAQHVVLRDYAVQHLVSLYLQIETSAGSGGQALRGGQELARDVLWEALKETDSSIAGTALLGLTELSEQRAEFDPVKVGASALELARSGSGELSLITAYQVCGRLGIQEAIPVLEQAALEGRTIPLRISAIGALGALGGRDSIPLLTGFLEGSDERLKLPAREALSRIQTQ